MKKIVFTEIAVSLFILILVVGLLLILRNPYGCEKNDINCLIERGFAHNDIFICSYADKEYKDCCFKDLAIKLKQPFFCNYITVEEGNCSRRLCIKFSKKGILAKS